MKNSGLWLAAAGVVVITVLVTVGFFGERRERTALERRVDSLLAAAPMWHDSAAAWTRERSALDSANAALKGERDTLKREAARWHVIADARDSGTVAQQPPTEQIAYWHDKYLAATREAMAATAALATETRRADSLEARAGRAEDRVARLGTRLDSVTVALADLRRSQECSINLVVTRVRCPTRTAALVVGAAAGVTVTLLAK